MLSFLGCLLCTCLCTYVSTALLTRFKYRQVEPASYGLEVDEILQADDAELNQFVSLRKLAPYSDNHRRKRRKDGDSAPSGDEEEFKEARKIAKKRKRLRVAIKERQAKEAEEAAKTGLELKGTKHLLEAAKGNKGKGKSAEVAQSGSRSNDQDGTSGDGDEDGSAAGYASVEAGDKKKRKRRKGKAVNATDGASSADVAVAAAAAITAALATASAKSQKVTTGGDKKGAEASSAIVASAAGHAKDKTKKKKKKQKDEKEVDPVKKRMSLYS